MEKLMIPVPKAGSGQIVEIDLATLPDSVYREIVILGCKTLINRGMLNLKYKHPDTPKLAMKKAKENIIKMQQAQIIFLGRRKLK